MKVFHNAYLVVPRADICRRARVRPDRDLVILCVLQHVVDGHNEVLDIRERPGEICGVFRVVHRQVVERS